MKDFGLYVHIPYCIKKCDYCDFYSCASSSIPDSYVEALLNELSYRMKKYKVEAWKTVYVGGGTPSLLTPCQIERLFSGIFSDISVDAPMEVTFEMNPETVTEEKLQILEKCGVTRISLGIQSLNDSALKAVGRHCTRQACLNGLQIIKNHWHKEFNLDAIAGLPGQSTQEFLSSLNEIISYNPGHLSMYTLTVEEGTPLYERIQDGFEVDGDLSDNQWLLGKEVLLKNGYFEYEVSNFSKPSKESLHNMLYWQQMDYVGIGCGGCGTVYSLNEDGFSGERWTNEENLMTYIDFWSGIGQNYTVEEGPNPPEYREDLDDETLEFEFLMMGLRTTFGVSENEYRKRFFKVEPWKGDLELRLKGIDGKGKWNEFAGKGLVKVYDKGDEGRFYALNESGLLFLNSLLLEL